MSHQWETGFMARVPSWHRLENLTRERIDDFAVARKAAGIGWEVATEPVYRHLNVPEVDEEGYFEVPDWKVIVRDDTSAELAIQPSSYAVISIAEFGDVINAVLGIEREDDPVAFEALFSLYGGRQIIALAYFAKPLELPWDPSETYTYIAFSIRFDGQGGLRAIPTNVRVQCANTLSQAEMVDGRKVGFSIRHTANWNERVAEMAQTLRAARGQNDKWLEAAAELARYEATARRRETFLKRFLPASDDMTTRVRDNVMGSRDQVRQILGSPTCEHIAGTGYGLLMAATEWSDHVRTHQSPDSYVARQLLRKEEPKARAVRVLKTMAKG